MLYLLPLLAQTPGDVVKLIDHAEEASNRWLFLAAIVFILIVFTVVIRYLVGEIRSSRVEHSKQITESRSEHAKQLSEAWNQAENSRKEHAATMKEMYGAHMKLSAEVLVALQENNVLLDHVGKLLERLDEQHRKA